MNGENWCTPDLISRARKVARRLGGGRRILMRELALTDHRARVVADVLAGRADAPSQKLSMVPAETKVKIPEHKSGRYKFGLVSDSHFGSTEQQPTMLDQMYDLFEREDVHQVYHCGDLLDGIDVYRGQIQQQFLRTMDDQVDYAIDRYPKRQGIKTAMIAGNHDLAATARGGLDPLKTVSVSRDDITYLGPLSAWVTFGPFSIYLLHPKGGLGYAKSYRLQRLIESFEGGKKPNVVVLGHWHSQCLIEERHVLGILPGCLCGQTSYERGLMLQPQLGGVILDIEVREDEVSHIIKPTFQHFFVPIERDR